MTVGMSAEDHHALEEMVSMYETLCTQLRTLKEDARIVSVYALYDCVSLILAHILNLNPGVSVDLYNVTRLQRTTDTIHSGVLNRMFLDFDKDFYGTVYYDVAMDAVGFDDCKKKLFWRKVKEYLVRQSPGPQPVVSPEEKLEGSVSSERSFDPETGTFSNEEADSDYVSY
jgi:hypothetical protein